MLGWRTSTISINSINVFTSIVGLRGGSYLLGREGNCALGEPALLIHSVATRPTLPALQAGAGSYGVLGVAVLLLLLPLRYSLLSSP